MLVLNEYKDLPLVFQGVILTYFVILTYIYFVILTYYFVCSIVGNMTTCLHLGGSIQMHVVMIP